MYRDMYTYTYISETTKYSLSIHMYIHLRWCSCQAGDWATNCPLPDLTTLLEHVTKDVSNGLSLVSFPRHLRAMDFDELDIEGAVADPGSSVPLSTPKKKSVAKDEECRNAPGPYTPKPR
jgi:hypothetical protein